MGLNTHHHADGVLLSSWTHLQTVIHHQVHERVKSSQDALYVSASIQLHCRGDITLSHYTPQCSFSLSLSHL